MHALLLDGCESDDAFARAAREELLSVLEARGWRASVVDLAQARIAPCAGCFTCWIKTPGVCALDDDNRAVACQVANSQLAAFLTPVTFGGYSSHLKKAVDHLIPNLSPFFTMQRGETHHPVRYPPCSVLGVGILPERDDESARIFTTLVDRNAANWRFPRHAAGVVLRTWDGAAVRAEIERLASQVGVRP